jgi:SAM-dependent methyltransferase
VKAVAGSVDSKWAGQTAAEHYASERFANARSAARDPRLVANLLREHGADRGALYLDAPSGAGRLTSVLTSLGRAVALDANLPMLERARAACAGARAVQASVLALPFADRSFEAVVCCRLLHHLRDARDLERAVRELVRVSRRLVIASFWDSASLPALRVRWGLKQGEGASGRSAMSRADLARLFEGAGAPVAGFRAVMRFVSQQTFLVAERAQSRA